MSLFTNFQGAQKTRRINLGTAPASSPDSVIARARAERQARERLRKEEVAARRIQRVWRGRREARRVRSALLEGLRRGESGGRALGVVLWDGIGPVGDARVLQVFSAWAEASCRDGSEYCRSKE